MNHFGPNCTSHFPGGWVVKMTTVSLVYHTQYTLSGVTSIYQRLIKKKGNQNAHVLCHIKDTQVKNYYSHVMKYHNYTLYTHILHIDGLVQERRSSIANALQLRLSCTNPSIWPVHYMNKDLHKIRTTNFFARQLVNRNTSLSRMTCTGFCRIYRNLAKVGVTFLLQGHRFTEENPIKNITLSPRGGIMGIFICAIRLAPFFDLRYFRLLILPICGGCMRVTSSRNPEHVHIYGDPTYFKFVNHSMWSVIHSFIILISINHLCNALYNDWEQE